jgi:hypothetical protein
LGGLSLQSVGARFGVAVDERREAAHEQIEAELETAFVIGSRPDAM